MKRLQIGAVLMDMDGLMFDTERVALEAWLQVGKTLPVPLDRALILSMVGRNNRDAAEILRLAIGDAFDYAAVSPMVYACMNRIMSDGGPRLMTGLTELMDEIDRRALPAAVVSGSPRETIAQYLSQTGLSGRFAAVVSGDMIPRGKPAPDCYLLAAERLGVAPSRCLVLEDAPAGIRAAADAGMIPVMIPDLIPPDAQTLRLLYRRCDTLLDVIGLL